MIITTSSARNTIGALSCDPTRSPVNGNLLEHRRALADWLWCPLRGRARQAVHVTAGSGGLSDGE